MRYYLILALVLLNACGVKYPISSQEKILLEQLSSSAWVLLDEGANPQHGSFGKPVKWQLSEQEMVGFSGCNTFRGGVKFLGQGRLEIGKMTTTRVFCPNLEQEQQLLSLLGEVNRYEIQGEYLMLLKGNLLLLQFKREVSK